MFSLFDSLSVKVALYSTVVLEVGRPGACPWYDVAN